MKTLNFVLCWERWIQKTLTEGWLRHGGPRVFSDEGIRDRVHCDTTAYLGYHASLRAIYTTGMSFNEIHLPRLKACRHEIPVQVARMRISRTISWVLDEGGRDADLRVDMAINSGSGSQNLGYQEKW